MKSKLLYIVLTILIRVVSIFIFAICLEWLTYFIKNPAPELFTLKSFFISASMITSFIMLFVSFFFIIAGLEPFELYDGDEK